MGSFNTLWLVIIAEFYVGVGSDFFFAVYPSQRGDFTYAWLLVVEFRAATETHFTLGHQ